MQYVTPLSLLVKILLHYILTSDAHGSVSDLSRLVSVAVLESSSQILVVYAYDLLKHSRCSHYIT